MIDTAAVRALASRGLLDKQIAAELGCRPDTVLNCRTNHRIPAGSKQAAIRWRQRITELVEQGHTMIQIVAITGLPITTAARYRAGLKSVKRDSLAAVYEKKERKIDA